MRNFPEFFRCRTIASGQDVLGSMMMLNFTSTATASRHSGSFLPDLSSDFQPGSNGILRMGIRTPCINCAEIQRGHQINPHFPKGPEDSKQAEKGT